MSRPGRLEPSMRCKRFASKIGKFPIRSCSSGKEGKHYFIAYTSGYMQRLVGRTAEGQTARQAAIRQPAETGSPKRSFRTTNDLHTRRQKKKERTKEV